MGAGALVWVRVTLGNGVKVYDGVWSGIALTIDDIVAVGSVVGVAGAADAVGSANMAMGVGLSPHADDVSNTINTRGKKAFFININLIRS